MGFLDVMQAINNVIKNDDYTLLESLIEAGEPAVLKDKTARQIIILKMRGIPYYQYIREQTKGTKKGKPDVKPIEVERLEERIGTWGWYWVGRGYPKHNNSETAKTESVASLMSQWAVKEGLHAASVRHMRRLLDKYEKRGTSKMFYEMGKEHAQEVENQTNDD